MHIPTEEKTDEQLFTENADKRTRLKALLADPLLVEAFGIAEDLMRPKVGGKEDGNHPLALAKYYQSAGADEFQNKLRRLTREHVKTKPLKGIQLAKTEDDLPKGQE